MKNKKEKGKHKKAWLIAANLLFIVVLIACIFIGMYSSFIIVAAVLAFELVFIFFSLTIYYLSIIAGALRHQGERLDEQDKKLEEALKPHNYNGSDKREN